MLQVGADKISSSWDGEMNNEGSQVWDSHIINKAAADELPSVHTIKSQLSQPLEKDNLPINSLLASNTANVQAALDSNPSVVQHHDIDSAAAANQKASLEPSTHSKKHHERSSKLGAEQTRVSASLQPHGNLNNITSKSNPQLSAALQPEELPQADRYDLLIVMPSSIDRMPIVTASRGWRQGVRTYIAFEQEVDLQNASSVFRVRINAY